MSMSPYVIPCLQLHKKKTAYYVYPSSFKPPLQKIH
jgi:hypothetical protein